MTKWHHVVRNCFTSSPYNDHVTCLTHVKHITFTYRQAENKLQRQPLPLPGLALAHTHCSPHSASHSQPADKTWDRSHSYPGKTKTEQVRPRQRLCSQHAMETDCMGVTVWAIFLTCGYCIMGNQTNGLQQLRRTTPRWQHTTTRRWNIATVKISPNSHTVDNTIISFTVQGNLGHKTLIAICTVCLNSRGIVYRVAHKKWIISFRCPQRVCHTYIL